MNLGGGRARRPDDWPSSHVRARSALSDRLDGPIDQAEAAWLGAHLDACAECRATADAYQSQRLELRALLDRMPQPPRDLWARTAAAIEAESGFHDGRSRSSTSRRRSFYAPSALLAAALVVAVGVGALTSSQRIGSDGTTGPSLEFAAGSVAAASGAPLQTGATPIPVARKVEYLARAQNGAMSIKVANVAAVCPDTSSDPCDATAPIEGREVDVEQGASSVFGSPDRDRLIVYTHDGTSEPGTVSVVDLADRSLASDAPSQTAAPPPSTAPSAAAPTPTVTAAASLGATSPPPSTRSTAPTPSARLSSPPDATPSPSVVVTPSPDGGTVEIARDVVLVGQSAAYSRSGDWFAFTARPVDGSAGPDIYLWKVGAREASPVTADHRSVFGSWAEDVLVGSTVVERTKGSGDSTRTDLEALSFALEPASQKVTTLPQTGSAWRPAVDPTGRKAVYWSGTLKASAEPGYVPDTGRLVLGDWGATTRNALADARPTALAGDQSNARNETTIAAGRMGDWDARWDRSGTHLAVWIADAQNPGVGRLSLYAVDAFDGTLNLKKPLLDAKLARAGYSISEGTLVWAESGPGGSTADDKIQLLAWTDDGVGTVETVDGSVMVIR